MEAVIIGYSGHALVVIDTLITLNYQLMSYCEQTEKLYNPYQLNYLGKEDEAEVLETLKNKSIFIGLGDNRLRANVYRHLMKYQLNCPIAIHPKAYLATMVTLGNGSLIMPSAVINACTTIGEAVICNTASVIEHECQIGDFAHIAPGAVLAGNVKIGEGTFVGANAVIKQGLTIGKNVTIGAGAVVTKNIGVAQQLKLIIKLKIQMMLWKHNCKCYKS